MARIAKADYFAGVFLTTILKSSKTVPMLCDASVDNIKCVIFDTNLGAFNVYVKYSTSRAMGWDTSVDPKKKRTYWNVNFSENEYNYLSNQFAIDGKTNLIAIVCTDKSLSSSWIAILKLTEALFCLKITTEGGNRTITVSRTGRNHTFDCYGVGLPHEMNILKYHPYVNHLRLFDQYAENGDTNDI